MDASEIGWGKYREYEGPFTRGTVPYVMPAEPDEIDKILRVSTSTEGGRWNAVNMYDRCILTVGLIQWCEGSYFLVSDLIGKVAQHSFRLLEPMNAAMVESGVAFRQNSKGRWRFHFTDARGEVDRAQEQRELFLRNSTGHRGSWDEASKRHAKQWAAAMVNLFAQPETIPIQRNYTVARKLKFALPFAAGVIARLPDTPVARAFRAAYLSFAGNNPTWANKHLQIGMEQTAAPEFSNDWLVDILRELTFGPRVAIYPQRYAAIRPVLERYYEGVQLPDSVDLLKASEPRQFLSVLETQEALVSLGYDLGNFGPKGNGVDGVYKIGGATYSAVAEFQRQHGIEPDENDRIGWVGDDTAAALKAAVEAVSNLARDEHGQIPKALRRQAIALQHAAIGSALDRYFAKV